MTNTAASNDPLSIDALLVPNGSDTTSDAVGSPQPGGDETTSKAVGSPDAGLVARPKLPNMNEFSPGTLDDDIQKLLGIVASAAGDKDAAIAAIVQAYPKINKTPDAKQRLGRASNALIGMAQCGLLEKNGSEVTVTLTPLANDILGASTPKEASDKLAHHLIENCYGQELFDIVGMLRSRGEETTLENIRDELEARGFVVTENETNPSKIRKWLETSGVVDQKWRINEGRLYDIAGLVSSDLAEWYGLQKAQRVFLEVLKEVASGSSTAWHPVRKIKSLAETRFGKRVFPTGRLRDRVIEPLRIAGWLDSRGKGQGRGGDSGDVLAQSRLVDIAIRLPLDNLTSIPADLRPHLLKPLDDIFSDLRSADKNIKGVALELLALNIVRDIGLMPVGFRVRSSRTEGGEVDLIAEGASLQFNRLLIQCKNTRSSTLEVSQIAKEVGMAVVLRAQTVVLVTTGKIGSAVQTFADGLARNSSMQAILIDGEALKTYRTSRGAALIDLLNEQARRALVIKRSQRTDQEEGS